MRSPMTDEQLKQIKAMKPQRIILSGVPLQGNMTGSDEVEPLTSIHVIAGKALLLGNAPPGHSLVISDSNGDVTYLSNISPEKE